MVFFSLCLIAFSVVALILLWPAGDEPAARLQVVSQTLTHKGQIVRLRLIPANRGPFLAGVSFQLAYDKQLSLKGRFICATGLSICSGSREFDVIFPNDYPIWRLEVEVHPQAPILERLKWDVSFTIESLKGCGWLPTPPEFFNLLESYKNFNPGAPKLITSEEIAFPQN